MKRRFTALAIALALVGCASPSKHAHDGKDDTKILVTIRPMDSAHYEMLAVLERGAFSHLSQKGFQSEESRYHFPRLVATLDEDAVETPDAAGTPEAGPKARLRVFKEAGRVIADYRAGFRETGRSFFTEGRVEMGSK